MSDEYKKKLEIARFAYSQIIGLMETIRGSSEYEIDFCWDECIWVDDILFQYTEMKVD